MQTSEKYWDNFDATIYIDGSTTHGTAIGIIVTSGPPSDPTIYRQRTLHGDRPSKTRRMLCERLTNWHRRMSPSTRCTVCQHTNAYKICTHYNKLQTPMKTRNSPTEVGCQLTSSWCLRHSAVRGNKLADMTAKEWITAEHEEGGDDS